jgi:hypothetical protein
MQTRHRIPTIFNLSLVDVLCCALGCVILLWLINFREAKRRAKAAGEAGQQLTLTRTELASARKELDGLRKKHDQVMAALARTRSDLAAADSDLDAVRHKHADALAALAQTQASLDTSRKKQAHTQGALTLTRSQLAALEETVKGLLAKNRQATAEIEARTKEEAALAKKLAAAGLTLTTLEKEITARKTQLVTLNSQVEDLNGKLLASAELVRRLRKAETDLKRETTDYRDKLATLDARALALADDLARGKKALSAADQRILALLAENKALELKLTAAGKESDRRLVELLAEKALLQQKLAASSKDLGGTKLSLAELEVSNKALHERLRLVRAATENRFAGLELTGKKVVFLIDISGSMKMRDETTPSPTKWPTVCATVGKVMKSLPDLTHYQVILFSNSIRYLHGSDGRWLTYKADSSPTATVQALREIDPHGGTKMSPAFAEVFRFRAQGLDTVYFFSDGLPNDDDDLPADVANLDEAPRTAYLCNRVRHLLKTVWNRPGIGQPPVRINTVGFFFDSPEVGAFLWALAREHDGGFVGMSRP